MAYDTKKEGLMDKISGGKIGTYKEAPGGGTPIEGGKKAPSKEWVRENRVMQPRDEDGKFTYNSANAKPLKYGPSRGETIPPFLKGVKLVWAAKKGQTIWGADHKRYIFSGDMTAEEFLKAAQEYIEGEGFGSILETIQAKKGRLTKGEKRSRKAGTVGFAYGKKIKKGMTINEFRALFNGYKEEFTGKEEKKRHWTKKTAKSKTKPEQSTDEVKEYNTKTDKTNKMSDELIDAAKRGKEDPRAVAKFAARSDKILKKFAEAATKLDANYEIDSDGSLKEEDVRFLMKHIASGKIKNWSDAARVFRDKVAKGRVK